MSIPSNIKVEVRRSSEDGQWFAKPGTTASGEKGIIFFQREGKKSIFQSLKDAFSTVRKGEQVAKEYLQSFGLTQNPGVSLNQHIKNLEKKAGTSGGITMNQDSKNRAGQMEFRMTEEISFKTTPTLMKQRLTQAICKANSAILDEKTKKHITDQINIAVEVSTNKQFASIIKPDPEMLETAAFNLLAYAGQLKDQPELAITLRKMIVELNVAASNLKRSEG
jgi:hypothetical protein